MKGGTLNLNRNGYERLVRRKDGVAPVISTMLLVVIMLSIVALTLYWGLPLIRENQDATAEKTNMRNMDTIEGNLRKSILEGPGFQLENTFSFSSTEFQIIKDTEYWIISYSLFPSINITYSGLDNMDNYFAIGTDGESGYPGFDLDDPECQKELEARVEYIHPKPLVEEPVQYLPYQTGFISPIELKGFLRISISFEDTVISEAWMFTLDVIELKVHTSSTSSVFAISNGALLVDYPAEKEVRTGPFIKENHETGSLYIGMVDLRGEGITSFTSGRYTIGFEVDMEHASTIQDVHNARIEVSGKWSEAWYGHFGRGYDEYRGSLADYTGFAVHGNGDSITYHTPVNSASDSNRIHADNIELKIGWSSVSCWVEK